MRGKNPDCTGVVREASPAVPSSHFGGDAMDILAHALWASIGVGVARRSVAVSRRDAALTVALAAAPDLLQLVPLAGWIAFGGGEWSVLTAYSLASPDTEPILPPTIALVTHHLHCATHSAMVAGVFTLVMGLLRHRFLLPLAGWWSHIVIDVFTHSADFYPSPVLYPLTMRGFHGVAWNEPWFMALNYAALSAGAIWLVVSRRRNRHP